MIDTTFSIEELNSSTKGNMSETLGIEFIEISSESLKAKMPVDHRTVQPIGILNGGASAALAETVGSLASYLSIDRKKFYSVGLEIKCNHLRSAVAGYVVAEAKAIHLGKRTHLWNISISDQEGKLICVAHLSMQILPLEENSFAINMLKHSSLAQFCS